MSLHPDPPATVSLELSEEEAPAVVRFPINTRGRDYVVGDIHGMFSHLEELLADVGFSPDVDRLFSVGDLVDRGPYSMEALDWLAYDWFHACRGNHEHFAINSINEEERDFWVQYNGGGWWMELSVEQQKTCREVFLRLPLAMEVETDTGVVGIVHADIPPTLDWRTFCQHLRDRDEDILQYAMFSRNRVSGLQINLPVTGGDIDRVYCGHTPLREPRNVDNVHFIDTAAVYVNEGCVSARLTMVEIQPDRHLEYVAYTRNW